MLATHLTLRAHSQKIFNLTNWSEGDLEETVSVIGEWMAKEFAGADGPLSSVVRQIVREHQLRAEAKVQIPIEKKRKAEEKIAGILETTTVKKVKEV